MSRPGTRLRTFAARVCSEKTMGRLIDPVIADLQVEYASATCITRRGLALVSGYIAFAKVSLWCGLVGTRQSWRNWSEDDRQNLVRVVWCSGLATLAIACLLEIPGMMDLPARSRMSPEADTGLLIAYLMPAALASSVPLGILIGATLGLAGRSRSRRLPAALLLVSLAISAVSFVNLAWVVPAANQSYREELIGGSVPKGERELTLIEMRRAAEVLRRWDAAYSHPDRVDQIRRLTFASHQRYAIACAPLTFLLLALLLAPRRRLGRAAAIVVSCALAAWAVFVSMLGRYLGAHMDFISPAIGAWLPHIAALTVIVLAGIMSVTKQQRLSRAPA